MIIETRYRDIPHEEVRRLHRCPPFDNWPNSEEEWERHKRGQVIRVVVPAQRTARCGQPMYRVVGQPNWFACSCLVEIGD